MGKEKSFHNHNKTIQIIIFFGLISLFGDIVYEGARSVNGPYLKTLGANAAIVGLIAGIAEFLGYAIRLVSGYFSDRTKAYWLFTILGYAMLITVPLLSLVGFWQVAAVLILLERLGKAIRSPARDTIVSQVSKQIGTGFGFGLHEAMDQIGAIIGPLIFTGLFIFSGTIDKDIYDYQRGYGLLWIPFLLLMICIALVYIRVPRPKELEISRKKEEESDRLSSLFWLYTLFSFIATLGFANFILLAYHFKVKHILFDAQIPLFYAIAMGIDAVAALSIGKIYDLFKNRKNNEKAGLNTLIIIPIFSLLIPIFAFSKNYYLALIGVFIWGVVMGTHETIMRSAIADITPLNKRSTGYGIFNTSYGLAMFIGSSLMGILYEYSIPFLVVMSIVLEIIAVVVFLMMRRESLKA